MTVLARQFDDDAKEMLDALMKESLWLRRDWEFFNRVFVVNTSCPQRHCELELLRQHAPNMAFHLRGSLEDAILLRLAKLTDRSKKSASIEKLINRLDTPRGTCPELIALKRQTRVFAKHTGTATIHRNERIAHLQPEGASELLKSNSVKIRKIQHLVSVSSALLERLRQLTGDPRQYQWPNGDEGSANEFLSLLNSAHSVQPTSSTQTSE